MSASESPVAHALKAKGKAHKNLRSFAIYLSITVLAAAICYFLRGGDAVKTGVNDAWGQLVALLVELALGLVIASAVGMLVPKDKVARWLSAESGFSGLLIAGTLGMITPGGPYASFPLVLSLSKAGADIGALIAFLTAWAASSVSRLVIWEIPMLGFDFAMLRFMVSVPLPLLAGYAARAIAARYPLGAKS
ncbi:permease [Agrobacterium larrymoorei]|nr:permease [Agrobacterium larrymoorei]QYA10188.1 permease [Agrobacterium larrymoorei]